MPLQVFLRLLHLLNIIPIDAMIQKRQKRHLRDAVAVLDLVESVLVCAKEGIVPRHRLFQFRDAQLALSLGLLGLLEP